MRITLVIRFVWCWKALKKDIVLQIEASGEKCMWVVSEDGDTQCHLLLVNCWFTNTKLYGSCSLENFSSRFKLHWIISILPDEAVLSVWTGSLNWRILQCVKNGYLTVAKKAAWVDKQSLLISCLESNHCSFFLKSQKKSCCKDAFPRTQQGTWVY